MNMTTELVSLINRERLSQNRLPLSLNGRLCQAAGLQAQFMADVTALTHFGPGDAELADRLRAAGYSFLFAGENLACCPYSAYDAFALWQDSPPHRKTMLYPSYTQVGVGVACGPDITEDTDTAADYYWCLILGTPQSSGGDEGCPS
ncbi:CAP domain-containing protein [Sneathiella chinensis]|uniref:SCP domain-containing protein n=1 Tax=Sneathiella chinensis TaxID=349750 RepID=A0ABQ5U2Q9_9PROT|nr:CAP domain-containing protein [Sneathiella chinensis]GLQ06454.1 hypothetical protein GCM10007924_16750 [Sneathiella chinensis]